MIDNNSLIAALLIILGALLCLGISLLRSAIKQNRLMKKVQDQSRENLETSEKLLQNINQRGKGLFS